MKLLDLEGWISGENMNSRPKYGNLSNDESIEMGRK